MSYKQGNVYATISQAIMGNGGVNGSLNGSVVEGNSTNTCIRSFSFLVAESLKPESSKAKLLLPIIPIMPVDIVGYAFTL